jgi:hypothetical protein
VWNQVSTSGDLVDGQAETSDRDASVMPAVRLTWAILTTHEPLHGLPPRPPSRFGRQRCDAHAQEGQAHGRAHCQDGRGYSACQLSLQVALVQRCPWAPRREHPTHRGGSERNPDQPMSGPKGQRSVRKNRPTAQLEAGEITQAPGVTHSRRARGPGLMLPRCDGSRSSCATARARGDR